MSEGSARATVLVAFLVAGIAGVALAQSTTRSTGVPTLPAPTGPYGVGTTHTVLVDSTRPARVNGVGSSARTLPVQLWYPSAMRSAMRSASAPAAYVADPRLLRALIHQQYYGLDSALISSWSRIRTHSHSNVPIAAGTHPFVTLSAGLGVASANYTTIAEELASYGCIVAAVDHPFEGFAILPGGTIATADDDSANASDDASVQRRQVAAWSADISFVLNEFQHSRLDGATGFVARSIDWTQVGAIGHSSGGLIAVEACGRDPRLRACVNLDGGPVDPHGDPIADFVREGLKRPTLFLLELPVYSDADLARRHITRAQFAARGRGFTPLMDSLAAHATAPFYVARVKGTGHFNFSDGPFVMPTTITRFGGRIIAPDRGWAIITTTVRTFFDQYLRRVPNASVTSLATKFPELVFDPVGRSAQERP